MGRKKINQEDKKQKVSVAISTKNLNKFDTLGVKNKSKLIEWLIDNHFNSLEGNSDS